MKRFQIIDMFSVHFVDDASLYAHYQDPQGHMNPIPGIYATSDFITISDKVIIKLNIGISCEEALIFYRKFNISAEQ